MSAAQTIRMTQNTMCRGRLTPRRSVNVGRGLLMMTDTLRMGIKRNISVIRGGYSTV